MEELPLFNSRIIGTYIEYLKNEYPGMNIGDILSYADITPYQLEDQGHWLTQKQVERFHEIVQRTTGNPSIAREAGRFVTASHASGILREYALGFLGPSLAYWMLEKLGSSLTRHITFKTRKIATNKVEITVTPRPGFNEKPFQCENRMGMLESLAKLFTKKYAIVEQPKCMHRGDSECRYLVSWTTPFFMICKRIAIYFALIASLVCAMSFFFMSAHAWTHLLLSSLVIVLGSFFTIQRFEQKDLVESIASRADAAEQLIDQINIRYNETLLIQEIGQAASRILDISKLLKFIMGTLEKRLDIDRGLIMLANKEKSRLIYTVGYGYNPSMEDYLETIEFTLDKPQTKGVFALSFRDQKPFLVNDLNEINKNFSPKTLDFVKKLGTLSFICVPIVYEGVSEGILAVDNIRSKKPFNQSDLSLLMGIAPQIGICINNARAYELVREREESFRALSENAPDIIYTIDTDGALTYVNPAWKKILGHEKSEVIGKYFINFARKEDARNYINLFKTVRDSKTTITDVSGILVHKNGTERLFNMNGAPNFDSDGNVTGLVGIFKDITEQHNLEIELRQAQKMQAIGTLSGGIAHDFNNILTPIIGYTELLVSNNSVENQTRWMLERILNASYRAKELVQQILTFSRQQTEQERKPVQISPIVKEALKLLRASLPATIEIKQNIDSNSLILGDPTQIHQVLMNLCTNAGHAMQDRGGILEVNLSDVYLDSESASRLSDVSPGSYIRLTVSDTGCGMTPDIKERVFEPFFTTKERSKGTGMGLSVVHGIIENYGGTITVVSEPDIGSTFNVYFPVFIDETSSMTDIQKPPVMGSGRILFVDDEKSVVEIGKHLLENLGYNVTTSTSGKDALELFKAQSNNFDLVITDMTMPNMTGDKLAEAMMSFRPDIPIIICTGYSTGMTKEKAEHMGVSAYVMKPLLKNEIAELIRNVLNKQNSKVSKKLSSEQEIVKTPLHSQSHHLE